MKLRISVENLSLEKASQDKNQNKST